MNIGIQEEHGSITISAIEYRILLESNIVLGMVKEYARQEEYMSDWRIREIIGVPKPPKKKEGEK